MKRFLFPFPSSWPVGRKARARSLVSAFILVSAFFINLVFADYGDVTYLAGTLQSFGFVDGTGTNVKFYNPFGVAISPDATYALIPEANNNVIRKMIISTSAVTVFAGNPSGSSGSADGVGTNVYFNSLETLSFSSDGSYALIADRWNFCVRKIIVSTINVTTFVGTSSGIANGVGTNAQFDDSYGICLAPNGVFAITVDFSSHLVRYIEISSATVSTLAGNAYNASSTNGVGTNVGFNYPRGVSISPDSSYVLIADTANNLIRMIVVSTTQVTTLAGSAYGYANGVGTNAMFKSPRGLSISPYGSYVLVADLENNMIRRIMISTGKVTVLAGYPSSGSSNGIGTNARFSGPNGISISPSGNFALVADLDNQFFRRLDIIIADYGDVSFLAGSLQTTGLANGVGTNAQFRNPATSAISPDETYTLVPDWVNRAIRKIIISTGSVILFAGSPSGGTGTTNGDGTIARFYNPLAISFFPDGNSALIADTSNNRIRKITTATASVTTFAGSSTGSNNGVGTSARFDNPYGVCVAPNGIFAIVVDYMTSLIRYIDISTVVVSTLAGSAYSYSSTNGIGTIARFDHPRAASISPDSRYILVSDTSNNLIRKIVVSTAQVTTLAGSAYGYANGVGTNAMFKSSRGLSISPYGDYVLIGDLDNNMIRRIAIATGEMSDFVGSLTAGYANGIGTNAQFRGAHGVTISPSGNFALVTDIDNQLIRRVDIVDNQPTPSSAPTSPPTSSPSSQPTPHSTVLTCPPFTTESTSNATENTIACWFWLCPYESVTISLCGSCNSTDTLIRLFDSDGVEVSWNDDGAEGGCGPCSSLSYVYDASTVRCDKLTLQQGCRSSESCVGESQITIESTTDELVKYGFGVSFGDSSILSPSRGLLVNYFLNPARGKVRPSSFLVESTEFMTETDSLPSSDWILIKWRPVFVNRYTNAIIVGDWENSTLIANGVLSTWIVSSLSSNIVGFIVRDLTVTSYRIYFFENTMTSRRRVSASQDSSFSISRSLSVGPGITISETALTTLSLQRYVAKVSNQRFYLLDSSLGIATVTFT